MKKSLIALAVAGVFAAPAAFAATANVDFYGKFRVSLDNVSGSALDGEHAGGWQMSDETSRIGFKGAEDLGGGLKAIYQWETAFNLGTAKPAVHGTGDSGFKDFTSGGTSLGGQRNTFIGLAGDFGTVLAGRHDTPYKMVGSADLFGDTLADAQSNMGTLCVICEDLRVNNALAYVSPNMGGFTFLGATVVGNGTKATDTTKSTNTLSSAYSLAGTYGIGGLKVGLAYENLGHVLSNTVGEGNQKAVKLNVGYGFDSVKLGATVERIASAGGDSDAKYTNYLVSAAYGMGPITLAAQYGKRNANTYLNDSGTSDMTDATVGVVYSLSKRTSTYLGYAHYRFNKAANTDSTSLNAVTLGLNHDF